MTVQQNVIPPKASGKMTRKRYIINLITLFGLPILGVIAFIILGQLKPEEEKKAPLLVKRYAEVVNIQNREVPVAVRTYGRVISSQPVDLIAEVGGELRAGSVPLQPGQRFRKGQILFRINQSQNQFQLSSQVSQFMRDLALVLPDIKLDFPNEFDTWNNYYRSINPDKGLPAFPSIQNESLNNLLVSRGIVASYYNIKRQQDVVSKHVIVAPFDGSYVTITRQIGSFVSPGIAVAQITRSDNQELKVNLDVNELKWLQAGQEVRLYNSDLEKSFKGRLTRIGSQINPMTQAVDGYIAIDADPRELFENMYFEAEIQTQERVEGAVISRSSLFDENKVYVIENDSLLRTKSVNIEKMGSQTAIISGLSDGTQMVDEPLVNVRENTVIYPVQKSGEGEFERTTTAF
jgi:multidrug efflux pump subunit AcrA (membrane-fusion protein)